MTYEEFQKYYEEDGDKTFAELSKLSESELLKLIANKNESRYQIWQGKDNYQVWTALQSKGTSKSIKPLFNIVSDMKNDYLIRYHACNALFAIAGIKDEDFKGEVQYGLDKNRQPVNRQNAIDKLENIFNKYSDL
ncbi:MAG TPA: hypothetical protein PLD84_01040 [Chitinophagales bacterium]|nr:hypothetical protein [Chitinophagales bacterium]